MKFRKKHPQFWLERGIPEDRSAEGGVGDRQVLDICGRRQQCWVHGQEEPG